MAQWNNVLDTMNQSGQQHNYEKAYLAIMDAEEAWRTRASVHARHNVGTPELPSSARLRVGKANDIVTFGVRVPVMGVDLPVGYTMDDLERYYKTHQPNTSLFHSVG
jgi:hypothetical protein